MMHLQPTSCLKAQVEEDPDIDCEHQKNREFAMWCYHLKMSECLLHSFILRSYLFYLNECFACMHISITHALRPWTPKEGIWCPEKMELCLVVSHRVGSGKWTKLLCKNTCSLNSLSSPYSSTYLFQLFFHF